MQYYSISRPVGNGWLKEISGFESQTNFFSLRDNQKAECGLDLDVD
jgi:hypothetical protein